jgi:hypothetical protein
MFETLILQILGLLLLLVALAIGYRLWVWPHRLEAGLQAQGLLMLIVLTMMGGFVGSPVWWRDDPSAFSWDLPPLAGRMLAAAGWSFTVVCFLVLRKPTARRQRLVLLLLAVYLLPLAAAIFAFHLDRFDFSAPITYAFFTIVALMSASVLWYLLRPPPAIVPEGPERPVPTWTRWWLRSAAIVTLVWGLALFWTDNGPSALIWAWPGDLLTSRLIGVMLLTIAAGAWYSQSAAGSAPAMLAMMVAYGVGVAAAGLGNVVAGKPLPLGYFLAFSLMAVVSLAAGLLSRTASS